MKISIAKLLSSCIDASSQGCTVIRDFYQSNHPQSSQSGGGSGGGSSTMGKLKEEGNIRSVVTQADIDAQKRIISGLRSTWGDDLLIIGEEEDDDDDEVTPEDDDKKNLLALDLLDHTNIMDDAEDQVDMEDLALFVDPLDGTREFVEGRLENVACLIGIAKRGRPIAGVIGLPFPSGNHNGGDGSGSGVEIFYAVADQNGSMGVWCPHSSSSSSSSSLELSSSTAKKLDEYPGITILTGDSKDPVLVNATSNVKTLAGPEHRHLIVGGTAAKLRLVATTPNSLAVLHFVTELWDTCAADALLTSNGGKVTDLFGAPLPHNPERGFGNIFGVVASSGGAKTSNLHDELCSAMRNDRESVDKIFHKWMGDVIEPDEPQSIDVARDLDGIPFSLKDLEKLVKDENPHGLTLKGYSVPNTDAWRGMMSNGARYRLKWSSDPSTSTSWNKSCNDLHPPTDIFLKRVVMKELIHARDKVKTAPHKLVRDVKSYQVETEFLTSEACRLLIDEARLNLNKVLGSDLRPVSSSSPVQLLDSKFYIFLEYMQESDGWSHQWLLDEEGTKSALAAMAKMHAYFWKGSTFWSKDSGKVGEELESIVWKNGGYMQPKLQGVDQFKKVDEGYRSRVDSFRDLLVDNPELDGVNIENLGSRLEPLSPLIGAEAHPFESCEGLASIDNGSFQKYRTLIHGDPKQANFFFRRNQETDKLDVGIIDFQWCGFGLCATDVAHHISAAVSSDCLSLDGTKEAALLDHYYSCLASALIEFGVASTIEEVRSSTFPREVLQKQYEVALLDICRMVFAYAWRRFKMEESPTPESLNRNSYNKSIANVVWLVTRCHVLLKKMEDASEG